MNKLIFLSVVVVAVISILADLGKPDAPTNTPAIAPTTTNAPTPRPELIYMEALRERVLIFTNNINTTGQSQATLDALGGIEQLQPPKDLQRFHAGVLASLKLCTPTLEARIKADPGIIAGDEGERR